MRVVAVSTWFPTTRAPSSGTFVAKDVAAIAAAGHDVAVVHLVPPHQDDGTRALDHEGLPVRRIPMATNRPDQILAAGRALRPLLDGADVVHTMAFSTLLPLAWWRPAAPWVHTEHWSGLTTPATLPLTWRVALPVLARLQARPDVTTAVCDFLARTIRRSRPGAMEIVPCIVPPLDPVPGRRERDGMLRLVGVGGLVERKDPVVAVRTVAALRERGTDAHLTWVGEGSLREEVGAEAARLGVADRVTLAGNQPTAGVSAALAAADLFFLPTRADNFCVSAAEALVHGRPVVVGATGGQGEYIDDAVGELVDRQDPDLYAAAIERVDAATRGLSAETIAGTIGDRFSAEQVAVGYERAYRRAIEVRARRARTYS
ncbi:glycosyltransferase [Georgenia yuyongxinii]|uniref:Glycosyltransferase n=1 Tax=Georgenia yuyongxinii TaxID=2589797 RepID=A0A5B8C8F7_9MICO|nr:glycosyltransferase [Georgenia yuyongxinii]QDC25655.1 glycosyltransferase [Georgenia yuyongxinii]